MLSTFPGTEETGYAGGRKYVVPFTSYDPEGSALGPAVDEKLLDEWSGCAHGCWNPHIELRHSLPFLQGVYFISMTYRVSDS
jgi:hypothetical protein